MILYSSYHLHTVFIFSYFFRLAEPIDQLKKSFMGFQMRMARRAYEESLNNLDEVTETNDESRTTLGSLTKKQATSSSRLSKTIPKPSGTHVDATPRHFFDIITAAPKPSSNRAPGGLEIYQDEDSSTTGGHKVSKPGVLTSWTTLPGEREARKENQQAVSHSEFSQKILCDIYNVVDG